MPESNDTIVARELTLIAVVLALAGALWLLLSRL